jgi:hypothetical protein
LPSVLLCEVLQEVLILSALIYFSFALNITPPTKYCAALLVFLPQDFVGGVIGLLLGVF